MKLSDAMNQARRVSRVEAQRENQRKYYERNRDRIRQRRRETKINRMATEEN